MHNRYLKIFICLTCLALSINCNAKQELENSYKYDSNPDGLIKDADEDAKRGSFNLIKKNEKNSGRNPDNIFFMDVILSDTTDRSIDAFHEENRIINIDVLNGGKFLKYTIVTDRIYPGWDDDINRIAIVEEVNLEGDYISPLNQLGSNYYENIHEKYISKVALYEKNTGRETVNIKHLFWKNHEDEDNKISHREIIIWNKGAYFLYKFDKVTNYQGYEDNTDGILSVEQINL